MITLNAHFIVLTINITLFLLFGFDKLMSKRKKFRIPELVLLLGSFFLGALGSLLGMIVFNHKTSKMKFRLCVPAFLLVNYLLMRNDFMYIKMAVQTIVDKISVLV